MLFIYHWGCTRIKFDIKAQAFLILGYKDLKQFLALVQTSVSTTCFLQLSIFLHAKSD